MAAAAEKRSRRRPPASTSSKSRRYGPGFVHKIVPTADRAKATVLTKVRFKERDERVLPEMSAKVTFLSKDISTEKIDPNPRSTVLASAVINRDGQDVSFLIRDNVAIETPVKTGERFGDRIEIKEGLVVGDHVVLRPNPTLSNNTRILVK